MSSGAEASSSAAAAASAADEEDGSLVVSASELQILQETFQLFDKDGDGCITTEELGTVLRCIGRSHSAAQLKAMLRRIDKDGNGTIEFEEFIQLMKSDPRKRSKQQQQQQQQQHVDADSEDELLAAFHVFDKDRNGFISAPELKTVLVGLGHEYDDAEVEDMLREVDINGDGYIDYAEFVAMLTSATTTAVPSRVPSRVSQAGGRGGGSGGSGGGGGSKGGRGADGSGS